MDMEIVFELPRGEVKTDAATIPADEIEVGWVLVGRAQLTPSIPGSRVMHALVFQTPDGEHRAVFLDKTTWQFRSWPVDIPKVDVSSSGRAVLTRQQLYEHVDPPEYSDTCEGCSIYARAAVDAVLEQLEITLTEK